MTNFDFKKYLAKNPLMEAYTPGSGWTKDFDYDDMLAQGLKVSVDTPIEDLEKMFADFEDVNYHREGEHLSYAIDALKDGNKEEAEDYINKFRAEIKKTIADYSDEYFDVNEAQEGGLDVASIAQQVADEFTKSDELDLKYVVTPGSVEDTPVGLRVGAGFDLDVEAGPNTPGEDWKDENGFGIDNYLGRFAGGSFIIKPEGDGYVIKNAAMKNAVVGYITPEGELDFVRDQEQHYDEIEAQRKREKQMANVFVREGDLIGNIGKGLDYEATLEKIKDYADRLLGADVEDVEDLMDFYLDNPSDLPEPLEYNFFKNNYDDILYYATTGKDELGEGKVETKSNKMKKSELKEIIKSAMLAEYEKNVNITDENPENEEDFLAEADEEVDAEETTDVTVDDTETIDTETTAEVNPNVKAVQDSLTQAMEAAKSLGDKKLESQIGNTITFFTRSHVAGTETGTMAEADEVEENTKEYYKDAEADDAEHIKALEKDMADDKDDSMKIGEVMFPMWTKLSK